MKLEFSLQVTQNIQVSNFIKVRPMRAELFHADGQTDMMKLIVAFRNFASAPKKSRQTGKVNHIAMNAQHTSPSVRGKPRLTGFNTFRALRQMKYLKCGLYSV
jgi:hypothetical protein